MLDCSGFRGSRIHRSVQIVKTITGSFLHRCQQWLAGILPHQAPQLAQDKGQDLAASLFSRYQGEKIFCNAQMSSRQIHKYSNISAECERLLETP
jgi:hypothetical protein